MSLSSSTLQAFAVEGITYSILCFLHVSDVDAIVSLFHETTELQGHLQDKLLWTQLLKQHFKGSRNIELRFSQHPMQDRGWNYTNRELTCVELQEFLHSMDECLNFDKTIQIVKGDIGDIQDIDGQTLDGIAFPTNSHLTNHYIGAAGAIFRRAGPNLSRYVNDPSFLGRRPTGSAVITPGFDAGVQKLIHCVGPRITMSSCYELLATTYHNVMNTILHEGMT